MPFIQVRDIKLYYETAGTGPRVLYISGTNGDLRNHPNGLDSPLASRFEVLGYDQRGLGQTDAPAAPYTMADYGEDANALLDALGWERCSVIGVSFGGMVAQEFAVRHQARIERLVLCCTASGGPGGSSYPLHELLDLSPQERAQRQVEISDTRLDEAWQAANPDAYAERVRFRLAQNARGSDDPVRVAGQKAQLEARRHHDTYDRLPSLDMPVLICNGRYDGQADPENARRLAERIPNARLAYFEGGHGFLNEDPRAYETVIAFFQGAMVGELPEAAVV